MLTSLGQYEDSFQPLFLTYTATFYEKEGQSKMQVGL